MRTPYVEYYALETRIENLQDEIDKARWKQAQIACERTRLHSLGKTAAYFGKSKSHIQSLRNAWIRRELCPDGWTFNKFYTSPLVRGADPRNSNGNGR